MSIYTLPIHGLAAFKLGVDAFGMEVTPDNRSRIPDPKREEICRQFLSNYIPKAVGRIMETKTCLYTMTLDRRFIVDTMASYGHPNIIVCCGAGHAFKFAGVLGKILSEMAVHGSSQFDIKPFTINRPAVTDPTFKPNLHWSKSFLTPSNL